MLLDLRSLVETPANTASATYGVTVTQATGSVRLPSTVIVGGRAGYADAVARKKIGDQRLRISGTASAVFAVTQAEGWDEGHMQREEEELLLMLIVAAVGELS
jgi:hypothetical protein